MPSGLRYTAREFSSLQIESTETGTTTDTTLATSGTNVTTTDIISVSTIVH